MLSRYKEWVKCHPNVVQNLDWLLLLTVWNPSRTNGGFEFTYEAYHAAVGLLSLWHQSILEEGELPTSRPAPYLWLDAIEYLETLIELRAMHLESRGKMNRYGPLLVVETVKAVLKMSAWSRYSGHMFLRRPTPDDMHQFESELGLQDVLSSLERLRQRYTTTSTTTITSDEPVAAGATVTPGPTTTIATGGVIGDGGQQQQQLQQQQLQQQHGCSSSSSCCFNRLGHCYVCGGGGELYGVREYVGEQLGLWTRIWAPRGRGWQLLQQLLKGEEEVKGCGGGDCGGRSGGCGSCQCEQQRCRAAAPSDGSSSSPRRCGGCADTTASPAAATVAAAAMTAHASCHNDVAAGAETTHQGTRAAASVAGGCDGVGGSGAGSETKSPPELSGSSGGDGGGSGSSSWKEKRNQWRWEEQASQWAQQLQQQQQHKEGGKAETGVKCGEDPDAHMGRNLLWLSELLHIWRPVVYVTLLKRYGRRSWRPWATSLAVDLLSGHFHRRGQQHLAVAAGRAAAAKAAAAAATAADGVDSGGGEGDGAKGTGAPPAPPRGPFPAPPGVGTSLLSLALARSLAAPGITAGEERELYDRRRKLALYALRSPFLEATTLSWLAALRDATRHVPLVGFGAEYLYGLVDTFTAYYSYTSGSN